MPALPVYVTVGSVLSICTVTDSELDKPAPLVAEQVSGVPAVSLVRVVGSHPLDETIPVSGSLTFQVTVTSVWFHRLALGSGATRATITGGVASKGRNSMPPRSQARQAAARCQADRWLGSRCSCPRQWPGCRPAAGK